MKAASTPSHLLTFRTQGRLYACDLLWVHEILRQPGVTEVNCAPPEVLGLIHLRGQILTALDLDRRLGHPPAAKPPSARCIVFKTAGELARLAAPPADADRAGNDLVGILVDSIGDILTTNQDLLPPPNDSLSKLDTACFAGVLARPEGLVALLNVGHLLSPSALAAT
jgi:purine-binding chemotaxis protein CheW